MVVFSVTYLVVLALHEVLALEGSWKAMMCCIQFLYLAPSLVSLFVVRLSCAQRKAIWALDEFASGAAGRSYRRPDSSSEEAAQKPSRQGMRNV